MATVNGSPGPDVIQGGDDPDYLEGEDGDDVIDGGGNADSIDGGYGSDLLRGGAGDDSIRDGADSASPQADHNQMFGESGNDYLDVYVTASSWVDSFVMDGGADNDRIVFNSWYYRPEVEVFGGDGNDSIDTIGGGSVIVDAGAGNDTIAFNYSDYRTEHRLTLGTGADLVIVRAGDLSGSGADFAVHITDFVAGPAGDRISLDNFLQQLIDWNTYQNPFATGHLALVQVGADAVLRMDLDGGGDAFDDIIVFEGVTAASLSSFNIGYASNGGATPSMPQDGTSGADYIVGAGGAELLRGLDGNDELFGAAGNDRIEGGLGEDRIEGGYGDDVLVGGDGHDRITDAFSGSDQLKGGEGNDLLAVERGRFAGPFTLLLDGGAGGDELRYWGSSSAGLIDTVTLTGGIGDDYISTGGAQTATIDAGEGDDHLYISNAGTTYLITLGSGIDKITLESGHQAAGQIIVSDYETGAEGDRLDLDSYLRQALTGWNSRTNPYETGFLRLTQRGSDAVLEMDRDGSGSTSAFADLIVFRNVSTANFTTLNLGGYSSIIGSEDGERLEGDEGRNTIYGLGGADTLVGAGSDDSLYGGSGVDQLEGGEGKDKLDGGVGADVMIGGSGDDIYYVDDAGDVVTEGGDWWPSPYGGDEVRTSLSTYVIDANVERLVGTSDTGQNLTGSAGIDIIIGGGGNDFIYLLDGDNQAFGGAGDDLIEGGTDSDGIYGGAGSDTLIGGDGDDYLYAAHPFTGGTGDDSLDGGEGDDELEGYRGNDVLIGGEGNDTLSDDEWGADRLEGGNGDDLISLTRYFSAAADSATLLGGAGNDTFNFVLGNGSTVNVDAGEDDDSILIYTTPSEAILNLTLGSGKDVVAFADYYPSFDPPIRVVVADFAAGSAGDRLDTADFLKVWLTGWNPATDPFATGHLRLVQSGLDTILFVDRDGAGSASGEVQLIRLQNFDAATLTAFNLGGFAPPIVHGTAAGDTIRGSGAGDRLDGGLGADTLIGGQGDDTYFVDNIGDSIVEAAGAGTDRVFSSISRSLEANVENLTLTGAAVTGTGNDRDNVIVGNASANQLDGGVGNDRLDGGLGADSLTGGLGDDQYVLDSAGDNVNEIPGGGTDTIEAAFSYTLAAELENLTLTSLAANGTGNGADNVIVGNAGVNLLIGLAGNDRLDGGAGADRLEGGLGDDVLTVDNAGDVAVELAGQGTDTVRSAIAYMLGATFENLILIGTATIDGTGNSQANIITGNDAANRLDGGAGADALRGGLGNDTYIVDHWGDAVTEDSGAGTDRVRSSVSHALSANVEHLDLLGGGNISGTGNALTNQINGNGGNNLLDGGSGTDLLFGGDGDDIYVLETSGDKATETSATGGTDTVRAGFNYTLTDHIENLALTGTAAINGTGNGLNNLITGNNGNNRLDGGAGADTLRGGIGNDVYVIDASDAVDETTGGGGIDTVIAPFDYVLAGNLENLTLTGSAVSATGNGLANLLVGNAGANSLNGLDGNDILDGGLGADAMAGGTGHDTYLVDDAGDSTIEAASAGTDLVRSVISLTLGANVENLVLTGAGAINGTGNGLSNQISGNMSANVLDGGAGIDFLFGGDGDDFYIVETLGDRATEVSASGGTDTVFSSVTFALSTKVENLTLTGSASVNAKGNELANVLIGNSGNNSLIGNAGADQMTGGLGNDIYEVDNAGDVVTEASGEGTDTVQASITLTLGANLENLTLTGAAAINGTGNDLNNVITGNNAANTLVGLDGDDILIGGAGADALAGGADNDVYFIDSADTLIEAAGGGTDRVHIGSSYTLLDEFEYLVLTGSGDIDGTGNGAGNVISGNAGNNTLDGGAGADLMFGEGGNDTYVVDNVGDRANEGSDTGGTDTVMASVTFTLGNRVENLTLTGSGNIAGRGNGLVNDVTGNSGNNVLWGGLGADSLNGGNGDDTFLYTATPESASASRDSISGFGSGDTIDLAAIDADTGTDGNQAFAYVGDAAFTGTAGELRAYQSGDDWFVEADADGDGAADLVIRVTTADPAYLIGAGDFLV